jgi:carbon-monoxide dehydrogenase medium subunit
LDQGPSGDAGEDTQCIERKENGGEIVSLPKFEYLVPTNIAEVCALLSQYGGGAKVIAGGTDLLVQMKERVLKPEFLVGIKGIDYLSHIDYNTKKGLRIGALASIRSIADSEVIREKFESLAKAASQIGTPQVRNMGTIGGNLCNAAPSADTAPPLIALGAMLKLVSSKGERIIASEKFFIEPGRTALQGDELLTEIQVPTPPPRSGTAYLKLFPRGAVDIAAVSVAALVTLEENGICADVKIACGAVAPTPIRAESAEAVIKGKKIDDALIDETARLASEESQPISDVRSSAGYRKEMVKVLTKRTITQALERLNQIESRH